MKKKIWILEIGEPLPLEGDVRLHRYGNFTPYLVENGFDVTWWTSSFSHAPKKHFSEKDADFDHKGATLRVLKGLGYPRNVSLQRIRHNIDFANKFTFAASKYPAPDLIITPIPTIESATAAAEFARSRKIPYVVDIRDHWPDELANLAPGVLRPLAKLALSNSYRKMHRLCRNADGIMGSSQNELNYGLKFAQRNQSANDFVFYHGYPEKKPESNLLADADKWCDSNGILPSNKNICFFGTIGKFFNLSTVIQSAKNLADRDVHFVLAGTGGHLEKYKSEASNLSNVHFPGWIDQPKIHSIMNRSVAGLAPYAEGTEMSLPNKPFEYMAASLPILSSIQGELTPLLDEFTCGWTYDANSAQSLNQCVENLIADPEHSKEMGRSARKLFDQKFAAGKVYESTTKFLSGFF